MATILFSYLFLYQEGKCKRSEKGCTCSCGNIQMFFTIKYLRSLSVCSVYSNSIPVIICYNTCVLDALPVLNISIEVGDRIPIFRYSYSYGANIYWNMGQIQLSDQQRYSSDTPTKIYLSKIGNFVCFSPFQLIFRNFNVVYDFPSQCYRYRN